MFKGELFKMCGLCVCFTSLLCSLLPFSSFPLSCLPCCCRMWSVLGLPLFDASYCSAVSKPRHNWHATTTTTPCFQPPHLIAVGCFTAHALMSLDESPFSMFAINKAVFHISWPQYNIFEGCHLIYRPYSIVQCCKLLLFLIKNFL